MPRVAPFLSIGAVVLDRSSPVSLHRQLYLSIRDKILTGTLIPGERVPSSRALAEELGLARNTVVYAFNQLIAEGYLESGVGSGTTVARFLPEDAVRPADRIASPTLRGPGENDTLSMPGSFTPDSAGSGGPEGPLSSVNLRTAHISDRGQGLIDVPYLEETRMEPFTPAFPIIDERFITVWGTLMNRAWKRMSRNQFGYPSALGYNPLREAIASYLRTARGVKCVSQQVIITDGAQQALNLIAALLINPGDAVWIEDPSYNGAKAAFRNASARLIPVPVDDGGFDVDTAVERSPGARLAYVSPSNQFPLGVTMDLPRRFHLIRWAEEANSWIVEDDYDSEFRYEGSPVMALQGMDQSDRVIYVGTFSKVLYPGLRLGYMVAPMDLIEPIHAIRAHADRGSPIFEQIVLNDYIREGHFARHIRRMRKVYSEKRRALLDAIRSEIGDLVNVSDSGAGLHVVVRLQDGLFDADISMALRTRGYQVPALSSYKLNPELSGQSERGGLLFGFTALEAEDMAGAVRRIRPVLDDAVTRQSDH